MHSHACTHRAPYTQPRSVETLRAHIYWRSLCAELRVRTGLGLTLPHPGPRSQLRATHTRLWRDPWAEMRENHRTTCSRRHERTRHPQSSEQKPVRNRTLDRAQKDPSHTPLTGARWDSNTWGRALMGTVAIWLPGGLPAPRRANGLQGWPDHPSLGAALQRTPGPTWSVSAWAVRSTGAQVCDLQGL